MCQYLNTGVYMYMTSCTLDLIISALRRHVTYNDNSWLSNLHKNAVIRLVSCHFPT